MSFQNNIESYDKISSMNNMIGISLIDILKPNIKTKQNDNVIKMLGIVKDEPEAYLELLSVAIIHRNFEIIKLIIEKNIKTINDSPSINSLVFFNSILPEDSKLKLNDTKENYEDIICPLVLMAGIGGNIDIFKYLMDQDLIIDLNIIGTIGLSKKNKNAINSNIVGACAFYGNHKLLDYLLKNYRLEVDINVITTEEKVQKNKKKFFKEVDGTSPPLLACAGPCSDEKTFEILKILEEYKANFEVKDFNENNIIHIATRNKKMKTVKCLINSFELKDFMNEKNKDNLTPIDIAKEMKNEEIVSFFNSIENHNEKKEDEKDLSEIPIDQKNQNDDKNEEKNEDKKYDYSNRYSNNKNYRRDYNDNNNYNNNYKSKYYYRNNYDYKNNYFNNYGNNNYYKKNSTGINKTTNQRNYYDKNKNNQNIQRNKNRNNENNYNNRNNNYSQRNQNRYLETNSNNNIITEEKQNKNNIEEKEKELEKKEEQKVEEEKEKKDNNISETKKEEEEIEEGSFSEEDFLNEKEDEINDNTKEENNSLKTNYNEYMKLYKKYMEIERQCFNFEKEKKEMYLYINRMNMDKKTNIYNIKSSEENINSLLNIANEELEVKNKYINELKKDCIMTDLSDIKNFDKEKLKKYKEFYLKNLEIINNRLKGHV